MILADVNVPVYAHRAELDQHEEQALAFAEQVRNQPHAVVVGPGPRHWEIFRRLCREAGANGGLMPDAYLAAVAIEHGCEFATADRGFARFPGLRLHPVGTA